MKPTVKRCTCGRVTNPVTLSIVEDAWITVKDKEQFVHFSYTCPQCLKQQQIDTEWDEKLS